MHIVSMPNLITFKGISVSISTGRGEGKEPHFHLDCDLWNANISGTGLIWEEKGSPKPNAKQLKPVINWVKDRKDKLYIVWDLYKKNITLVPGHATIKNFFKDPDTVEPWPTIRKDGMPVKSSIYPICYTHIKSIKHLENRILRVFFADGRYGEFDFSQLRDPMCRTDKDFKNISFSGSRIFMAHYDITCDELCSYFEPNDEYVFQVLTDL